MNTLVTSRKKRKVPILSISPSSPLPSNPKATRETREEEEMDLDLATNLDFPPLFNTNTNTQLTKNN